MKTPYFLLILHFDWGDLALSHAISRNLKQSHAESAEGKGRRANLSINNKENNNRKTEIEMVIQRWQSVMLLIAGVMMGIFSFCSLGQIQATDYTFNVTALGICREGIATAADEPTGMSTVVLFILSLLSGILPLIDIFCFRNMPLQKKIALVSGLFAAVAGVIAVFQSSSFASGYEATVGWSTFICAPLIALIADILAWRLINSDQKKLRAADRLR